MPRGFEKVLYFFPVQLILVHVKRNPSLIFVWILLVAIMAGGIGKIYGVPYLFLDPEYVNNVGFFSFFLVGLSFGCFTMAFHMTCYILDGHRFPFIGVLERPFSKFSINNSILPALALLTYLVLIIRFQRINELSTPFQLIINISGLLAGISVMLAFFVYYFRFTNKDIFKFLTGSVDKRLKRSAISRERVLERYKESRSSRYIVNSYLDTKFRLRSCEGLNDFYDKRALLKVFDQNHLNTVILEIVIVASILILGAFMDYQIFQIPAAASILLLMTILVMVLGAVSFWLKSWGLSVVFGVFLLLNLLVKTGVLKGVYEVRGINYDGLKASYTLDNLANLTSDEFFDKDYKTGVSVLENWKKKQDSDKPKILFVCVSGGGQRAALWTVNALQQADKRARGSLMDKTFLITGASGGMIGAAYYRDIVAMDSANRPSDEEQLVNISKDNLNSVIYSLLVNDMFFRVRQMNFSGKTHLKDRGYAFEENLDRNLKGIFREKLSDYRTDELSARIPGLLLSPVIANDGRKLYVSNLPVTYMNVNRDAFAVKEISPKIWGVDFNRMFEHQDSEELSFLSALRMSASFPYITPTINLPSKPQIEIMDAGIADNFGVSDAVRFIAVFEDWITENTSGVGLLIIRDTRKLSPIEPQSNPSLVDRLTYPIASVYNNLGNMQDINNDLKLENLKAKFALPIEVIELEYNTYTNIDVSYLIESKAIDRKHMERAALSWHLTTKEKQNIIHNIQLPNNQKALKRLGAYLNED